eukprot:gene22174-biopygen11718
MRRCRHREEGSNGTKSHSGAVVAAVGMLHAMGSVL